MSSSLLASLLRSSDDQTNRDSEDSRSEDDREEDNGGFWGFFFTEVVDKKAPQVINLTGFEHEVPLCAAWQEKPR